MLAGYDALLTAAARSQWNAEEVALARDRRAWRALPPRTRERLERLLAGFWLAEHQVAEQLEPYVMRADGLARDCLQLQRGDERRHARFFERALTELADLDPRRDAAALAGDRIRELFCGRLQATAAELGRGARELSDAVYLYHLILEAIVLSTGQMALSELCKPLPATAGAIARVQRDERWHVGLGVTLIHRSAREWRSIAATDELASLAEWATTAWGAELVDRSTRERALAAHRRRLALLAHPSNRG
jgi:ribonucleoside-diphosphate reductase beta chain